MLKYDIQCLNGFCLLVSEPRLIPVTQEEKVVSFKDNHRGIIKNDMIYIKNEGWFQINIIQEEANNRYRLLSSYRNDTSILMLPLLFNTREELLYEKFLINGYVTVENGLQYMDLLYRKSVVEDRRFQLLESKFKDRSDYLEKKELGSIYIIYRFSLHKKTPMNLDDLELFFQSKFSKFSPISKERILNFHSIRGRNSKIEKQFKLDEKYRKELEDSLKVKISSTSELRSSIYKEREILDISKLIF